MALKYTKAERVYLKQSTDFDEQWVQNQVNEDPSILGLGEVVVIERERKQGNAGRLDLLLFDQDQNRRYEVELMLGPTDPSHIIRTIEYWDIERRRYPAYDHVAVLVAEDITSRFPADRAYWEARTSPEVLGTIDRLLSVINEKAQAKQMRSYKKGFIGLSDGARARNFVLFTPRKQYVRLRANVNRTEQWIQRLTAAGLETSNRANALRVNVSRADFDANQALITELLHQAVAEHQE